MTPSQLSHHWTVWGRTSGTWRRVGCSGTEAAALTIKAAAVAIHGESNVKLLEPIFKQH